jgi:RHS repeat-associated protein
MSKVLRKNEELLFTFVAYGLLGLVLLSLLFVELARSTYASRRDGPSVLSIYPSAVVTGASQTVTVLSQGTHFGPRTIVSSDTVGVHFSNIRFVSPEEMSFEVYIHEPIAHAGATVPITVSSHCEESASEVVDLSLEISSEAEPLALDLYNFHGKESVEVDRDYVMLGYKPRGYAPFLLTVLDETTGKVITQRTSSAVEHLGVRLEPGRHDLELRLSDALGREVAKRVWVTSKAAPEAPSIAMTPVAYANGYGYTGQPTQWGTDALPAEQVPASDCVIGNGPLSCDAMLRAASRKPWLCGGGEPDWGLPPGDGEEVNPRPRGSPSPEIPWGRGVEPPPNDYVATPGQVEFGGYGVLLHNGQFRETAVDLYIPGRGLDFVWRRTYQSGIDLDGYFGKSWDFSWGAHFKVENPAGTPTKGRFSRGDARRDLYDNATLQGGEYVFTTHPTGFVDIKTSVVSGYSEIRQSKRNGFVQSFDLASGHLKTRKDRYTNTITVNYDYDGTISSFTDTLGRSITVDYGESGAAWGRITQISDFTGRTVTYEYAYPIPNNSAVVALTKVRYPATTWLDDTQSNWPQQTNVSRETAYTYDPTVGRLSTIKDGRGKVVVQNTYDSNGRVDYQNHYSSGTVVHDFTWSLTGTPPNQKVASVLWKNRAGNERNYFFDPSTHLSTKVQVKYTPLGGNPTWVDTLITRGCACTLPTAIQEPDGGYTTFDMDGYGNVTTRRQYYDTTATYTQSPGYDLVEKAYFAPLNATQLGVCTKYVGPKAFTATPNETAYQLNVTYDYAGNPLTLIYPHTTSPATQTGHTEYRTYNSYGQLLTVARPLGQLTTYTYYSGESPASNRGYLKEVKVKYKDGASNELITTCTYTDFGALNKVKDPLGRETTFTVDSEFLVKEITSPTPFSYVRKLHYNGARQVVKEELQNRHGTGAPITENQWWETRWERGTAGEITTAKGEVSQSGSTITWESMSYGYDNEYRLTLATDGLEKETQWTLDERGLAKEIRLGYQSADESLIQNYFDAEGKLEKTVRPFTNPGESQQVVVSELYYDKFDRLEWMYDGEWPTTAEHEVFLVYNLGSQVIYKYESSVSEATLLRTTAYQYDELDRLWLVERGSFGTRDTTTYEHDQASRIVKITDDNGNARRMEYDYANRLVKTILPSINGQSSGENWTSIDYDLNSNPTRRVSHEINLLSTAKDFEWIMSYDALNRLTSTSFNGSDGAEEMGQYGPDAVAFVNTYDTRNLVIKQTDVDGVPTEYEYEGLGRPKKTTLNPGGTNPSEIILEAAYDVAGNLTSRRDGAALEGTGNVTSYTYDGQNRLKRETLQDGDWIEYLYNQLGNVKSKQWGNTPTQGPTTTLKTLTWRYDIRGLPISKQVSWTATPTWTDYDSFKTTSATFAYDTLHRLTNAIDDDTRVTFTWNQLDQITQETLEVNLRSEEQDDWKDPMTTTSVWDHTGKRRSSVTYPISGKKFEFAHDALNRVTEIRLDASPTDKKMAKYSYEGSGFKVTRRERGVDLEGGTTNIYRTNYTRNADGLGRLTEIKHERDTGGPTPTLLRDLDYTWGDGSTGRLFQRASYKISGGTNTVEHDYVYDNIGRLDQDRHKVAAGSVLDDTYDFDHGPAQFWNWMKKDTVYEKQFDKRSDGSLQMDEYTEAQGTGKPATYDIAGNMLAYGVTGYRRYSYHDHEDRLVHVHHENDSNGYVDHWFRYDALGRRVSEKAPVEGTTVETIFYYDGLHIVEETDASLGLNRLSLFGVKLDEVLYSGDVVSGSLTDHRWPMENHLGSVVVVVDNDAAVKSEYDYKAYGEATNSGGEAYPYQFTGRRSIEVLSLLDYRTRAYDPKLGRFLSRDVIGIHGDPANLGNGQAYAGNDPVNSTDPLGLADCKKDEELPLFVPRPWGGVKLPPGVRVLEKLVHEPVRVVTLNPWTGEPELLEWDPEEEAWQLVNVGGYTGGGGPLVSTGVVVAVGAVGAIALLWWAWPALVAGGSAVGGEVTVAATTAASSPVVQTGAGLLVAAIGPPGSPGLPIAGGGGGGQAVTRFVADSAGVIRIFLRSVKGLLEVGEHAAKRITQRGTSLDAVEQLISTQQPFPYFHEGVWKSGFYDAASGLFVGSKPGVITTVITHATPQYINNLKAGTP